MSNPAIGFVIADGDKFYPAAGNWSDGAVITRDYWATFYLMDHTFSGSVGEGQWIGLSMTCNYSMNRASLRLSFDTSLVELALMNWDTAYFGYGQCMQLWDGSYQLMLTSGDKMPATNQDQVCSLLFVPQCGLVNDTVALEIIEDSSIVWPLPAGCAAIRTADWYDRDGFIAEIDSAGLTGYFDADPVGMYDFSQPVVDLVVQAYNSFEAGMADAGGSPIRFCLNGDGNYRYNSHSTDSGGMAFDVATQNDSLMCLQQTWGSGLVRLRRDGRAGVPPHCPSEVATGRLHAIVGQSIRPAAGVHRYLPAAVRDDHDPGHGGVYRGDGRQRHSHVR